MHPLSAKARRRLVKAINLAKLGEHPAAIKEFREMKMQPSLERALRHKEVLKA